MDKEVSEMASLRVRHRVQTQHIVQVNGCLSSFQKERLKSTPFKWLVDMVDDMVISSPILIELINLTTKLYTWLGVQQFCSCGLLNTSVCIILMDDVFIPDFFIGLLLKIKGKMPDYTTVGLL
ncbi:hypothetical protein LR48_Vigan05g041900 [Vigna angularis]|uniref:Uncharacterized protein n=1 Tax=Phaseolus angularis TaxID=3914 RepID=A0A0L9UIT2_PHAAN|nr:hypothetical protein LR48_Vigan05g041900 [Vigna angularis]